MKKKLKDLLRESNVWDRKFGESLPTLKDTTAKHAAKQNMVKEGSSKYKHSTKLIAHRMKTEPGAAKGWFGDSWAKALLKKYPNGVSEADLQNDLPDYVFGGANAGGTVTTCGSLTMLGHGADPSGNTTSGEIVIGYNATGIGSNYVVLGSGDITRVYMSSDGDAVMYADGTINTSDRRTKQNIEKLNIGLDFINKLNPVTYNKRQLSDYDDSLKEKLPWHIRGEEPAVLADEEISKSRVGFIAQDVGEVLEELGFDSNNDIVEVDDKTEKQHLDYAKFVPALVKSVQELSSENKKLKNKLNDLEIFIMDKLGDDK